MAPALPYCPCCMAPSLVPGLHVHLEWGGGRIPPSREAEAAVKAPHPFSCRRPFSLPREREGKVAVTGPPRIPYSQVVSRHMGEWSKPVPLFSGHAGCLYTAAWCEPLNPSRQTPTSEAQACRLQIAVWTLLHWWRLGLATRAWTWGVGWV